MKLSYFKSLASAKACAAALASFALLTGCSTPKMQPLEIQNGASVLSPDANNNVTFNATLILPPDYVSKRSIVTIDPVLVLDNKVALKMDSVSVAGNIYTKKELRRMALHGISPEFYGESYSIKDTKRQFRVPISDSFHLTDDFSSGRVEAYVTSNGCGSCYGTDTVVLAYISNLSNLIDISTLMVQWVDTVLPPTQKSFHGDGQARLQFEVNRTEILPNLANNAAEMDSMLRVLTPVLKDPLSTLNSMTIRGSASAEGIYKKNVQLAQDRATAAKEWINARLNLTPAQMRTIKVGSDPEGWGPVIASMHAAGDPDSALVKKIVQKYPDITTGKAEKEIRKLSCWPRIAERHLAKDRRVVYTYDWTIKSFDSDEEVLAMYESRPDALNESEYLRVAKLKEDGSSDELITVYETMLNYIPDSKIAINNLAVLYHDYDRPVDAIRLIEVQRNPTDAMLTTLAVCYAELGDIDHAIEIMEGIGSKQAEYNVGVLLANRHRMPEAYNYLYSGDDLNAAIVALGVFENDRAWKILSALDDNSPKADYVRAITQTRLGNKGRAIEYLRKACVDDNLRRRALGEADFMPIADLPEFVFITSEH